MLRKALFFVMVMLAVPNFASAYNYWSITASTSPSSILSSAITAPTGAGVFAQSGAVTNVTSSTQTSADFTVSAPAGYVLTAVTVDGVAKGNAGGTYTVQKGSKITHTISATYATVRYTISTSKTGNGVIDASATVPYNGGKVINMSAGTGYQIASVTTADGGALDPSVTYTGDQYSRAYSFAAVQANQSIKVNFVPVPTVNAKIATAAQTVALGTPLVIDGSTSSSSVPPTFTWSVSPATGASLTGNGGTATFTATASGSYTVTLKLSAAGAQDSSATVVISAASGAMAASNVCLTCHANRSVATVAAYGASRHAATANASCQGCHAGEHGAVTTFSACAACHTSAGVHGVAELSCSSCHNSHSLQVGAVVLDHTTVNPAPGYCGSCHKAVAARFATSLHGTREGKATWYNDNVGNPGAPELQKGFGNYVQTAYAALPCGKCHNAAAWTVGGVDQWASATGGAMACTDCHGNKTAGVGTSVAAPVTKATCFGCHSRQANEASAGLTDVHFVAGMGCPSCHSSADMHGNGTRYASQLEFGAISAQCENCHGEGKSRGPISSIAAHTQHAGNIACSTCHAESMITCHNCHFDNEAGVGGAFKAKFFSGKFGGTAASGNAWRFLVNRVMPDGSTKIYPGSMQSLVTDHAADGANDGQGHTHAGIAPYYSHTITRVNALTCDKCHGTETAVRLAAGQPVRVTTWNAGAGVAVPAASVATTFVGPKGVIPVPENPRGKLLMDFVDLVNPELGTASNRVLFQKDGPDTIHMPQAYVKPLTAAQLDALALPFREGATDPESAHAESFIGTSDLTEHTSCAACHVGTAVIFPTSQHATRQGKATWYNDNVGNPEATELQKGFGNYVQTAYAALPCGKCHNAAAWTVGGVDQWTAATGGVMVCTDCHGNKAAGVDTTSVHAPVSKATCFGCHSRQANEASAGLSDVHFVAGMGCSSCHSSGDMHGTGTTSSSQLVSGTISAQCENCHGEGKARGPISNIAAHLQHAANIACSTCHAESMITCHNCHFDNEAGVGGALKAKFFSGKFGGSVASGNSWRFLVNRVMPDGSTKIYPGSMQSLVTDVAADGSNDGLGHTHAGIAPYYSHTITRVNALSCDKCHGTETAVKLAAGQAVRVTTWKAEPGVAVPAASVAATFVGPKGVIPVPENPRGKLLMDFVDLTNPELGTASNRVLFQKDGPDTIHMPEAYVKPLSAEQMQKLASVQMDHGSSVVTQSAAVTGFDANTCQGCHASTNASFAKSLHGTRQGKDTYYSHNLGNAAADPLQKGFGNYVTVAYGALPCVDCHNPAAWTVAGTDTWPAATASTPVCTDCHSNKVNGAATTAFDAPVAKATCIGCHSRQANEASLGLTDVHMNGAVINGQTMNFTCSSCHGFTDLHGDGTQKASQLDPGAVTANCDNCHTMAGSSTPEHTVHLANIACSTCHMESVITCYGCHFDNEASNPADSSILHAKFASGKFGGTGASSWRFLVNRVMPDGSSKIYPASMQSLVADRTAANAPGEDNAGWTHAAIAPYYSHSITRVNALKCDKCHGIQKAIDLKDGVPVRVVKWSPNLTLYPNGEVPVSAMGASYTVKPSGVIPVPENPVGKLLMDFVDLVNPAAGPLNASGTSPSPRKLFKADGPDSIHMPDQYVRPLTAAQINALATPQVRP